MKTSRPTQKRKRASDTGHSLTAPIPGVTHNCFACSPQNKNGLHLRFKENPKDGSVECEFRMPRRFEGPPGHLHGGIIATVLDETMGKVNRRKGIVALTGHMSIDYIEPVPLATRLCAFGWPVKIQGRKHFHAAEIRTLDGAVLARSQGTFIAIDPVEMFRKYTQRLQPKAK